MNFKIINLFFLLTTAFYTKTYIYNINFFNNKLFCLGDIHLGMNERFSHPNLSKKDLFRIHKKQTIDLVNFINKLGSQNCIVIIEDFFDIPHDKYKAAFDNARKRYLNDGFSSVFDFINDSCIKNNIKFINAECRQMSVLFFDFGQIKAHEFLNDFEKIFKEINNYNDTKQLNNYYKKSLNNILINHKKFIDLLYANRDKFINEIIVNHKFSQMKQQFITDYFKILDLVIVHNIHKNKNIKHIFLVSGANHIYRINKILNSIGFVNTKQKEYSQLKPLNLQYLLNNIDFNITDNHLPNINYMLILIIIAVLIIKSAYIYISSRRKRAA